MKPSRRQFLKTSAAAGATLGFPALMRAETPLRVAVVGITGRCRAHYEWIAKEKVAALCDSDRSAYTRPTLTTRDEPGPSMKERFPKARFYDDYREMFEKPEAFDTVLICTPDHHHYPIAARGLQAGKAVLCEKPLTWSTWEAQQLADLTARLKLPTQMGNQGMATIGWRIAHAYYSSGAIGDVTEVVAWHPTQGGRFGSPGEALPIGRDPVPEDLNWDVWLGPAAARAYKEGVYHPARWRQWTDYGGGTLGDWGCHTLNVVFKLLEPTYPTKVETVEHSEFNRASFPQARVVRWTFPEHGGRAGFVLSWYENESNAPRPRALEADRELAPEGGCYLVGTKGTLMVAGGLNNSSYLIPETARKKFGKPKLLVPGSRGHFEEFIQAAKGRLRWDEPLSNFIYAGHLSGIVSLGNAALFSGQTLEINPATRRVTNVSDPDAVIQQRSPRPGWYTDTAAGQSRS